MNQNFAGKRLRWSPFLIKLQGFRPSGLQFIKEIPKQVFSCEIFKNTYCILKNICKRLLLNKRKTPAIWHKVLRGFHVTFAKFIRTAPVAASVCHEVCFCVNPNNMLRFLGVVFFLGRGWEGVGSIYRLSLIFQEELI